MLRGVDIPFGSLSAQPSPVRETSAVAPVSDAREQQPPTSEETAPVPVEAGNVDAPVYRYNSFEFRYRPDVGRVVLIGQSSETGERVTQLPSEQVLRAYAERMRAEKVRDRDELFRLDGSGEQGPGGGSGANIGSLFFGSIFGLQSLYIYV